MLNRTTSLYRPSLALEAVETATLNYNRLRFPDGCALFSASVGAAVRFAPREDL